MYGVEHIMTRPLPHARFMLLPHPRSKAEKFGMVELVKVNLHISASI